MKRFLTIVAAVWCLAGCSSFGQRRAEHGAPMTTDASTEPSCGETMIRFASRFVGAPYTAGTLEGDTVEQLVVNLQTFDCTTFVESVLALTRARMLEQTSAESYRAQLAAIRYRGGVIDGYASRLHYFSDWIADNERRGIVADITRQAGGVPDTLQLDFMSRNADRYPALRNDPAQTARITECEKQLRGTVVYYLPTRLVETATPSIIQSGDIIAFTTGIDGLDIAHTGIALRQGSEVYLLHASSSQGKVVLDSRPLPQILRETRRFTGIRIVRPLPPSDGK